MKNNWVYNVISFYEHYVFTEENDIYISKNLYNTSLAKKFLEKKINIKENNIHLNKIKSIVSTLKKLSEGNDPFSSDRNLLICIIDLFETSQCYEKELLLFYENHQKTLYFKLFGYKIFLNKSLYNEIDNFLNQHRYFCNMTDIELSNIKKQMGHVFN